MAGRFQIEAVFRAIDRISAPIKKMGAKTSRFSKRLRRDFALAQRRVDDFTSSVRQKLGAALRRAALVGLMGLALAVGVVAREFVTFDHAIISATAKFKDVQIGTKAAKDTMEAMRKVARKVGAETQFSATQAAEGLQFLGMAGFKSSQAMALLPGVVDLATVANVDLGRATDIASDALGAFGLMTDNTAQLQKNFTRINDVMAKTITSTNTDMEMLFETMKYAGPAFTTSGQSLESFSAIAGRMAANGIKASMAGTALRGGILRLAAPPKKARAALAMLGITIKDADGNMRDIMDILDDVSRATKGMGNVQKAAALQAIFGTRAFSGWAAVINEGTEQSRALRDELNKATGTSKRMAEEIRKSLQNRLKALASAAIELGFKFMEAFEKQGGDAVDSLTKAIREFDPKPIIMGLSLAIKIISTVLTIGGDLLPLILGAVAAWKAYQAILIIAAAKQWLLNIAIMANPLGLIAIGIGILVGAIILLYKNWDKVKESLLLGAKQVADFFKMTFFSIADIILTVFGTVAKAILDLTITIGEFIGKDVSELQKTVEEIEDLQRRVRGKGIFGVETFGKEAFVESGTDVLSLVARKSEEERAALRRKQIEQGIVPRVETQREAIQKSITEKTSSQELIIRNPSTRDVELGGKNVPIGSTIILEGSG